VVELTRAPACEASLGVESTCVKGHGMGIAGNEKVRLLVPGAPEVTWTCLRPRLTLWLGIAGGSLLGHGLCCPMRPSPPSVWPVCPPGNYQVTVSESHAAGQRYNAVLFGTETATVILDAPNRRARAWRKPRGL